MFRFCVVLLFAMVAVLVSWLDSYHSVVLLLLYIYVSAKPTCGCHAPAYCTGIENSCGCCKGYSYEAMASPEPATMF